MSAHSKFILVEWLREGRLEFFCEPVKLDDPDHGGALGGDLLSAKHSVYADRESSGRSPLHRAAAYPLHPLEWSHGN